MTDYKEGDTKEELVTFKYYLAQHSVYKSWKIIGNNENKFPSIEEARSHAILSKRVLDLDTIVPFEDERTFTKIIFTSQLKWVVIDKEEIEK